MGGSPALHVRSNRVSMALLLIPVKIVMLFTGLPADNLTLNFRKASSKWTMSQKNDGWCFC